LESTKLYSHGLEFGKETSYFFSNSIPPRVIFSYILADQRVLHTFHLTIKRRKKKKKEKIKERQHMHILSKVARFAVGSRSP